MNICFQLRTFKKNEIFFFEGEEIKIVRVCKKSIVTEINGEQTRFKLYDSGSHQYFHPDGFKAVYAREPFHIDAREFFG